MKSLIICGNQMSGKTSLPRFISSTLKTQWFLSSIDKKSIEIETQCIIVEDIFSKKDIEDLKKICSENYFTIRFPYSKATVEYKPKLLIGITQNDVKGVDFPNSLVIKLSL